MQQNEFYNSPRPYLNIPQRSIPLCIIFTLITCGIYGIYWFIKLVDELNLASGRHNDMSGGMVFLLTFITCGIYGLYWFYKAGEKVNFLTGSHDSVTGILYLALDFFGLAIINYCLIQSELNNVAR